MLTGFSRSALICPQLLYPFPYLFVDNCRLGVGKDTVVFRVVVNPLFQFMGLGVGLEIYGTARVPAVPESQQSTSDSTCRDFLAGAYPFALRSTP